MDYTHYTRLAPMALGREKSGLVLKNALVINVHSGEILPGDIAIEGDTIIGVGSFSGRVEVDLQGKTVCPGFMDAHLHLESTLANPRELIHTAMLHGTTTFIVDPHEVANVAGTDGIDHILAQTEDLPANVFVMMPSCVPAVAGEENGASVTAADMQPYLANPRVLGLGEVMDLGAVVSADPAMLDKLTLFAKRVKDGHAPGASLSELDAYALAGIATDHECTSYEAALNEVRRGMQVLVREGSGAKNLKDIISGIVANANPTRFYSFCTDDKHITDIEADGHISHNVRQSIALGLRPLKAVQMATINTAQCYGLNTLGAIAPGRRADLVVLNDLESVDIHSVYCAGTLVPREKPAPGPKCPAKLRNTVHVPKLAAVDLALAVTGPLSGVIEMIPGQLTTNNLQVALPVRDGHFLPDSEFNKVVAVERHKNTGHVGVAPVKGFCVKNGAIGTSQSHDSHNIVIVGDSDEAILLALDELKRVQGGYVIVRDGKVSHTLPLPVMGLMSEAPAAEVEAQLSAMLAAAHELGVPADLNPFIALSFIALPVIPHLRVTTRGLYDVLERRYL
ncbi:adenine deaminase [Desulfovibrio sp. OttesenSCG-928-G15]|nr:adenine deaminase [Desulfovibrio sp. OttesenSCG-928-G15]